MKRGAIFFVVLILALLILVIPRFLPSEGVYVPRQLAPETQQWQGFSTPVPSDTTILSTPELSLGPVTSPSILPE